MRFKNVFKEDLPLSYTVPISLSSRSSDDKVPERTFGILRFPWAIGRENSYTIEDCLLVIS